MEEFEESIDNNNNETGDGAAAVEDEGEEEDEAAATADDAAPVVDLAVTYDIDADEAAKFIRILKHSRFKAFVRRPPST